MEDAEADAATNELEVVQVLWVNARSWVDLQGIVVVRRVLEQTVERVEHLVGQEEEEFSAILVEPRGGASCTVQCAYLDKPP